MLVSKYEMGRGGGGGGGGGGGRPGKVDKSGIEKNSNNFKTLHHKIIQFWPAIK